MRQLPHITSSINQIRIRSKYGTHRVHDYQTNSVTAQQYRQSIRNAIAQLLLWTRKRMDTTKHKCIEVGGQRTKSETCSMKILLENCMFCTDCLYRPLMVFISWNSRFDGNAPSEHMNTAPLPRPPRFDGN